MIVNIEMNESQIVSVTDEHGADVDHNVTTPRGTVKRRFVRKPLPSHEVEATFEIKREESMRRDAAVVLQRTHERDIARAACDENLKTIRALKQQLLSTAGDPDALKRSNQTAAHWQAKANQLAGQLEALHREANANAARQARAMSDARIEQMRKRFEKESGELQKVIAARSSQIESITRKQHEQADRAMAAEEKIAKEKECVRLERETAKRIIEEKNAVINGLQRTLGETRDQLDRFRHEFEKAIGQGTAAVIYDLRQRVEELTEHRALGEQRCRELLEQVKAADARTKQKGDNLDEAIKTIQSLQNAQRIEAERTAKINGELHAACLERDKAREQLRAIADANATIGHAHEQAQRAKLDAEENAIERTAKLEEERREIDARIHRAVARAEVDTARFYERQIATLRESCDELRKARDTLRERLNSGAVKSL